MNSICLNDVVVRANRRPGDALLGPLSLQVLPGKTLVLCGESGAGKTLLIELLAGLRLPDAGNVRLGERELSRIAPAKRGVALATQSAALFDHLDVERNIGFAMQEANPAGLRAAAAIADCAALLDRAPRRAGDLSGGERRRVALAKALAADAPILLLDEPFEGLDPLTHQRVRLALGAHLKTRNGITVIALHDRRDVFALADSIALFANGALLQHGAPDDLLHHPARSEVLMQLHDPAPASFDVTTTADGVQLGDEHINVAHNLAPSTPATLVLLALTARIVESTTQPWRVVALEKTCAGNEAIVQHIMHDNTAAPPLLRVAVPADKPTINVPQCVALAVDAQQAHVFLQNGDKK